MNFIVEWKLQTGWIRPTITAPIHQEDAHSFVQHKPLFLFLPLNLIESDMSFTLGSQFKYKDKQGEINR